MKFLLNYPWPGNVRELRNIVRRAVLLVESDSIELGNFLSDNIKLYGDRRKMDVTQPLDKGVSFEEITKETEKDLIKST